MPDASRSGVGWRYGSVPDNAWPTAKQRAVASSEGAIVRVMALTALSVLLATMGLAACSPGSRKHGAAEVAGRFVAAISAHDGAKACQLLTEQARDSVTGATDANCAAAVLNVDEQGDAVRKVEVWGDAAQVHVGSDVVFLLHMRAGWRVSAAGCTAQPSGPYKCDVDG